ncbi:MAG: aldehyde dehydrogenase family protein [Planctomycetota bacterium]
MDYQQVLQRLGIGERNSGVFCGEWIDREDADTLASVSPIDGTVLAHVTMATEEDVEKTLQVSEEAFREWRMVPAPKRGLVVRDIGEAMREHLDDLGALVTMEMGKIRPEGIGEVQEVIDMADFAVGLSRQLYGSTMQSERPHHRMYDHWQPLGTIGIITAFNFPIAVWGWNACLAAICGDSMIWKPSSKTPLTAVATTKIAEKVLNDHGCPGIMNLLVGRGSVVGEKMINDRRIPLISATGSCKMGRRIGQAVAGRLGRSLLELGGNNAVIVLDDADIEMAMRAVLFGAVGTAGQRCTSTRRLLLQKGIAGEMIERLLAAYAKVTIGDPLADTTLMGPLVDESAVKEYTDAIATIKEQGGEILTGGDVIEDKGSCYVLPTIVKATRDLPLMQDEVFAPILYAVEVEDVEDAIDVHNDVDQGLSSSIFTMNMRSAETFLSARGSDCGIANVNIGTSGAEIGGAFGGEKDTGGGREAGSDSWKQYMRQQTSTINWGADLPLAQGIEFG